MTCAILRYKDEQHDDMLSYYLKRCFLANSKIESAYRKEEIFSSSFPRFLLLLVIIVQIPPIEIVCDCCSSKGSRFRATCILHASDLVLFRCALHSCFVVLLLWDVLFFFVERFFSSLESTILCHELWRKCWRRHFCLLRSAFTLDRLLFTVGFDFCGQVRTVKMKYCISFWKCMAFLVSLESRFFKRSDYAAGCIVSSLRCCVCGAAQWKQADSLLFLVLDDLRKTQASKGNRTRVRTKQASKQVIRTKWTVSFKQQQLLRQTARLLVLLLRLWLWNSPISWPGGRQQRCFTLLWWIAAGYKGLPNPPERPAMSGSGGGTWTGVFYCGWIRWKLECVIYYDIQ